MTTALALDDELPADAQWAATDWAQPDADWSQAEPHRASSRPSVLDAGSVAPADLVRPIDMLARRSVPALPVAGPLRGVLPDGLRRGSTVAVTRSMSLLLALLGAPSRAGAWCALVGMPPLSAEAAAENGIELARLALVPAPGSGWLTAVSALLDAMDVVAVRPPASVSDGDIRRLSARARTRGSILMPYLGRSGAGQHWPRADVNLDLEVARWTGLGAGHGRLHARQVTVRASGRGSAARPRTTTCWLPSTSGGIADLGPAPTVALPAHRHTDPLAG